MKGSWWRASSWLSNASPRSISTSHRPLSDETRWVNTLAGSLRAPSQSVDHIFCEGSPSVARELQQTAPRFFSSASPSTASITPTTAAPRSLVAGKGAPPQQPDKDIAEALRSKQLQAFQIQHAGGAVRGFYVALRKSELSVETGLALRDLRVLDSVLQSQLPVILVRPRSVVVSLAHVRAVLQSDRAFIFNVSSARVKSRLLPNLLRRLAASAASNAAQRSGSSTLSESAGRGSFGSTTSNRNGAPSMLHSHSLPHTQAPTLPLPHTRQHDHHVMEAGALPEGSDAAASTDKMPATSEGRGANATSNGREAEGNGQKGEGKEGLGRGKDGWVKGGEEREEWWHYEENGSRQGGRNGRKSSRNRGEEERNGQDGTPDVVCPNLESGVVICRSMQKVNIEQGKPQGRLQCEKGDEEEMDRQSNEREDHQKRFDVEQGCLDSDEQQGAAIGSSTPAAVPFELQVFEALLEEVDMTLRAKFAAIVPEVLQGVRQLLGNSKLSYEAAVGEQQDFLRSKNRLLRFEMGANQLTNAIKDVLSNDEDMAGMYLTRKAQLGVTQANPMHHSEVEELLEDYLKRCEEVVGEVEALRSTTEASSEYLRTALDSARNQLIRLDVLINMATCSLALGGAIAAIFGMNLVSSLEDNPSAFMVISSSVWISSSLVFCMLLMYAKRKRIM